MGKINNPMKTFLLSILLLCLMNPVFLMDESLDSSEKTVASEPVKTAEADKTKKADDTTAPAKEAEKVKEAVKTGDSDEDKEKPKEEPKKDEEKDKTKDHLLGVVGNYSTWCMNNAPPCRDECCRLNWWGRRRCCHFKPWAPCCGGFQWHFPGYMVASTWEGAVPNTVGMHYHHEHPVEAPVYQGGYNHSHEHSH